MSIPAAASPYKLAHIVNNCIPSKFKRLDFAIMIILGVGLTFLGMGLSGILHVGAFSHISQISSAIFLVMGIAIMSVGSSDLINYGKCESVKYKNSITREKFAQDVVYFGAAEWLNSAGAVVQEPLFPKDIYEILDSPCPFYDHLKVKDTHMLILIPATVNGENLTLDILISLMRKNFNENEIKDIRYEEIVRNDHGSRMIQNSYWMLMTRDNIKGSEAKSFDEQKKLIEDRGYDIPRVLEASVCIFMAYVTSKTLMFPGETFTRCSETISNHPVAIGGFDADALNIGYDVDEKGYGVAALRRFM